MPGYRIDPVDLQLFTAVVEAGTITRGAREMNLSLAACSERLQLLEHALGAQLLQRTSKGVRPSDAGRTLLKNAGAVLRAIDHLHLEMAAHLSGVRGTIRLLCNTSAFSELVPAVLGRYLSAHADIDVDVRELWSYEILEELRREQADLGIVTDAVDTSGLDAQPLHADRLVAVMAASRPLAGREEIRYAELLDLPFVTLPPDSALTRYLRDKAARMGKSLHSRVHVRSFDAVAQLVAQDAGIAVLPEAAARRCASTSVAIVPLSDAWALRQLVLCGPRGPRPTHLQALVDLLVESSRDAPAGAGSARRHERHRGIGEQA